MDLAAEQRRLIAWGKTGEPRASQSQPQVADDQSRIAPCSTWRLAAKSSTGRASLWLQDLGFHEHSLSLGSFTPGYQPPLLRSYQHKFLRVPTRKFRQTRNDSFKRMDLRPTLSTIIALRLGRTPPTIGRYRSVLGVRHDKLSDAIATRLNCGELLALSRSDFG